MKQRLSKRIFINDDNKIVIKKYETCSEEQIIMLDLDEIFQILYAFNYVNNGHTKYWMIDNVCLMNESEYKNYIWLNGNEDIKQLLKETDYYREKIKKMKEFIEKI